MSFGLFGLHVDTGTGVPDPSVLARETVPFSAP